MNTIPDSVRGLLIRQRGKLLAELIETRAQVSQKQADLGLLITDMEAKVTLVEAIDAILEVKEEVGEDEYEQAFETTPEPTKAERTVIRTFDEPASDEGFVFPSYTVGDEIE